MQDAQFSSDQNPTEKQDDLLVEMLDSFWCLKNNSMTMTSKYRMVSVAQLLANKIRTWAPPKEQARICHLAINEVADRLLREARNDLST